MLVPVAVGAVAGAAARSHEDAKKRSIDLETVQSSTRGTDNNGQ